VLAGYGDYSPSVLGSQMMVIGILIITFTVLPYQTNALVGVISHTNPYSSAAYSPAAKGRHVVVTGGYGVAVQQLAALYTLNGAMLKRCKMCVATSTFCRQHAWKSPSKLWTQCSVCSL
jgi:hypothetical protein